MSQLVYGKYMIVLQEKEMKAFRRENFLTIGGLESGDSRRTDFGLSHFYVHPQVHESNQLGLIPRSNDSILKTGLCLFKSIV